MSVTFAKGFSAAGVAAGISSVEGKKDLALVVNQGPLDSAAGVFTFNRFCAAPVQWSRKTVADGHIKAVILNSGGANACTGQAGYEQSAATAKKVAELVGTQPDEIAVCSTGLIGELLPLDHVLSGVESAYAALSDDDQAGSDASHAIMTTDTKPKTVSLEGDGYRIGGMVKGSGMIAPQQGPLDSAAGVFTFNRFCAAPVQWSRKTVADGHIKAVILNSGGANACTGQAGYEQSAATAKKVAELVGTQPDEIAVCSTGLIGELLPLDHVLSGVESAYAALSDDDQAGSDASHAIMTTDTKPKTVSLEGDGYRIGGMVKGSGMIAPQLATMLCVITTDAAVGAGQLQAALNAAVDHSFNRIDVDGCMSTNDTVLLLASGASGVEPDPDEFNALVAKACTSLARQIIGDGEGASHDVRITVTGATTESAALACARAVAASNLLKCAIAGNDPNWGRIVSSLGTVPVEEAPYDSQKVTVDVNGVRICENGGAGRDRSEVDMTPREVHIDIDLNAGDEQATVWTDDLTHEYVHINADYES